MRRLSMGFDRVVVALDGCVTDLKRRWGHICLDLIDNI